MRTKALVKSSDGLIMLPSGRTEGSRTYAPYPKFEYGKNNYQLTGDLYGENNIYAMWSLFWRAHVLCPEDITKSQNK